MSTIEDFTRAYREAVPEELAGAVNLMAHPLAGIAAASALGLGFAGHAFGLWAGAVAGATEASQKLFAGLAEAEEKRQQPARLTLVSSQPEARRQPAPRKATQRADAAPARKEAARPAAAERPATPDDLKRISGVGPKLEKVLNGLGIWTYAQVAALTGEEIARLDEHLGFSGRIGRDDWVGQAAGLSAGSRGE